MAAVVNSIVTKGVVGQLVRVEVDLLSRLPSISIVGLANHSVKESTERVRSALNACGYDIPKKRIVINLAPAGVPKNGTGLDLPIAIGILAASNQIEVDLSSYLFVGELSLTGRLRSTPGAISMAESAIEQDRTLVGSRSFAQIAQSNPEVRVIGAEDLTEVVEITTGVKPPVPVAPLVTQTVEEYPDLSDVKGQLIAKRALEISAAGAHHLLIWGPPGSGKSMLAKRLPGILPAISKQEALECLKVRDLHHSETARTSTLGQRPFRAPHHSSTLPAMVGDRRLRPGEISLAHRGVLFLDEAPEFRRNVLESLREPLEDRQIRISRASGCATFPASIILVLAANPCPCGYYNTCHPCSCSESSIHRYRARLSGPILDRIDIQVDVPMPTAQELFSVQTTETTATVRRRVQSAREFQHSRGQQTPNSDLARGSLHDISNIQSSTLRTLQNAMEKFHLSARSCARVLSVARTIADLERSVWVYPRHLAEALAFRPVTVPAKYA